jgi:hypothetical protein
VQQAEALRTFSSGWEQLLFSIMTNGALAEDEARMVDYYCKEILDKVAPYLRNRPPQTPT